MGCQIAYTLDRVSYFLFPALFIGLLPLGLWLGAPWLALVCGAVVVPALDEIIGHRAGDPIGPSATEVRLLLIAFFLVVAFSLSVVSRTEDLRFVVLAGLSSGYVLGAVGIAAAHELGHRKFWADRLLSEALLVCIGYGHYRIAHARHHVRACLPDDSATARREESLGQFFPRYVAGVWRDAMWAVHRRRGYRRRWPMLLMAATIASFVVVTLVFSVQGLVFWTAQALVGLFLIGGVDYIQHWALRRRQFHDGRWERTGPMHTWESPFWLSERVSLNLTRHNFHHLEPSVEAAGIGRVAGAPEMPFGYGTMVIMAAIPPLFRKVMEPRIAALEAVNPPNAFVREAPEPAGLRP